MTRVFQDWSIASDKIPLTALDNRVSIGIINAPVIIEKSAKGRTLISVFASLGSFRLLSFPKNMVAELLFGGPKLD